MPKNTTLLVIFLAIAAALVVGVNIGRKIAPVENAAVNPANKPQKQFISTPTPTVAFSKYSNSQCGVTFQYPQGLKTMEAADGNTIFIDQKNPGNSLILICQKQIPTPKGQISNEEIIIGSASARLYKESSSSGEPVAYHLLFTHPGNGLKIMISGLNQAFENIVNSLELK